jgi:hypothetical protein
VECEGLPLGVAHVWGYLSVVDKAVMKGGYLPGELSFRPIFMRAVVGVDNL